MLKKLAGDSDAIQSNPGWYFHKNDFYYVKYPYLIPPIQPRILKIFGFQYITLTPKLKVRLNGVLPVEAHAQSCVYIVVRTRMFILKIFSFGHIVCSCQHVSHSTFVEFFFLKVMLIKCSAF